MQNRQLHIVFKLLFVPILFIVYSTAKTQDLEPIGLFDHHQDVGNPKLKGSAMYNPDDQTYTLTGAGINMWTNVDQFHFVWKKIKGDFIIRATPSVYR